MLKKSKAFAVRIVRLYKYLRKRKESVIAKQMLRSGTSIGANIAESRYAQSKSDFSSKLQIALKEAVETEYWLEILYKVHSLTEEQYRLVSGKCGTIRRKLIASITTAKKNADSSH